MPDYRPLFHWVREREALRRRRAAGETPPWTQDEILANYRFCNVRREDDRVTRWIAENIRTPFAGHPLLWFMLCIARQVNLPETLAALIEAQGAWPIGNDFDPRALEDTIARRLRGKHKVWTGAYVIAAGSVAGVPKHVHVVRNVLMPLYDDRLRFAAHFADAPTIRSTHGLLSSYGGWGPFMAYQAVVDMRFTRLLQDAPDVANWAAAGPGTLRGLNRLHGRALSTRITQAQALDEIRAIDAVVRQETGVEMDFSDIPNILCETDKYLRVLNGEGKPRSRYMAKAA